MHLKRQYTLSPHITLSGVDENGGWFFWARRPGTAMKGPIHPFLLRFRPCGDSVVGPAPTVSTRPEAPVTLLCAEKVQDHFSNYYLKDATGGDGCI